MSIFMHEVVCRDGFQMEGEFVPTEDKVALIDALSNCGLNTIEVTSFTSARAIPALRDAEEVMGRIRRHPKVRYTVLVPNRRGAERAMDTRPDALNLVMSVSQAHNRLNLGMRCEESFLQLADILRAYGHRLPITVSLSCAFGCPMEGAIAPEQVWSWVQQLVDAGAFGITLCDTTGMAHPLQVEQMAGQALEGWPTREWTLHFHNTRGLGLANVLAAVRAGANRFDASLGGLGGCPYAPGASGNICTEDTVHMLEAMGMSSGVHLKALIDAAKTLPKLVGHPVPGQVLKAGRIVDLHPMPEFA
jgi:hydroxymethylglutaryl-CoA lyase